MMLRKLSLRSLLAILAVTALGAIASSSASAVEFTLSTTETCVGGKTTAVCYNKAGTLFELTGKQSAAVKGGPGVFKSVVSGLTIEIECKEVVGVGVVVNQPTPLTAKTSTVTGILNFKGCKLIGSAEVAKKCSIPVEKETAELTGKDENTKGEETNKEILLKPTTGTKFLEIPFTNNGSETCPTTLKSTAHNVTGEEQITVLEPEALVKEEGFKKGESVVESKLKFGEEKATLSGKIELQLTGLKDEWSLVNTA